MGATARFITLALLAIAIWFFCGWQLQPHDYAGLQAPKTSFSAQRADQMLARLLASENPHPLGSEENLLLRARILNEFKRLQIPTTLQTSDSCTYAKSYGAIQCARLTNIIAEVKPGTGKAIVLMAHYDSVAAGPGAADDGSGIVAILEVIRALKARNMPGKHPIIALLTDGEEYGLLGAKAFLKDPGLKARVGVVINVEARGNKGPSILFQTSQNNAELINLYAQHAPRPLTSSLFVEIYKRLPNDTDLSPFIAANIPSLNFAFIGNVAHYHSPLDKRANLSLESLQHQGENLLSTTLVMGEANFAALNKSEAIYLSLFNRTVLHAPAYLALPIAIGLVLLTLLAVHSMRARPLRWDQHLRAFALPPLFLIGCIALGFAGHGWAQLLSHMPDPSFAHPWALRVALSFAVAAMALLVAPLATSVAATRSIWLWLSLLGLLTALLAPGISPYFLIPGACAVALLLLAAKFRHGWLSAGGQIFLLVAGLINLVIWFALLAVVEDLMGLQLHPLFMATAALGVIALIPVLGTRFWTGKQWGIAVSTLTVLAIGFATLAGLLPSYNEQAPQQLNLHYVEDHAAQKAVWTADTAAPLPPTLRSAANFSADRQQIIPIGFMKSYIAPAGSIRLTPPAARYQRTGAKLILNLASPATADMVFVAIPDEAGLQQVAIKSTLIEVQPSSTGKTLIGCIRTDCDQITLKLRQPDKPFEILIGSRSHGLPSFASGPLKARPATAMPNRMGDGTILLNRLHVKP